MDKKKLKIKDGIPAMIAGVAIFVIWFLLTDTEFIPKFMLPSPIAVVKAFVNDFGLMMQHSLVSVQESVLGLLIGFAVAVIVSVLMDRFIFIYKAFYPLLIITQTIPTIAIAPLLILWMGFGMAPKITLVTITSFFPIAVNMLEGFKSVDDDEINLLRSFGASKLQIYYYVKFPLAKPHFFAGLKIATAYSVVAAVISEWLGGFEGLGVYMTRVKKAYAMDKMFAVIILITILSLILISIVNIVEKAMNKEGRKK